MLLVKGIKLPAGEDESKLQQLLEKKLKHPVRSYGIHKKSLDARKEPFYVYSLLVDIENEERYLKYKDIESYVKEDFQSA